MSMVMDGVEPRSRRSDPVTSVDAGRSVDLCHSQTEVLALFYVGGREFADHELVEFAAANGSAYTPQRLRSARSELTRAGFVREVVGVFRPSPTRRRAHVWRLA